MSCRNKNSPREGDGVVGCPLPFKGLTPLTILDEGTIDHSCYIKNVLSIALRYGNEVFGDKRIFQQDGTNLHRDHLTQEWCQDNFPPFIKKDRCPLNGADLNHLDDSIWDELSNVIDWNKVLSKTYDTDSAIRIVGEKNWEINCR